MTKTQKIVWSMLIIPYSVWVLYHSGMADPHKFMMIIFGVFFLVSGYDVIATKDKYLTAAGSIIGAIFYLACIGLLYIGSF